jgi:hypothetical protein
MTKKWNGKDVTTDAFFLLFSGTFIHSVKCFFDLPKRKKTQKKKQKKNAIKIGNLFCQIKIHYCNYQKFRGKLFC